MISYIMHANARIQWFSQNYIYNIIMACMHVYVVIKRADHDQNGVLRYMSALPLSKSMWVLVMFLGSEILCHAVNLMHLSCML